jgi:hypothetical protein
MEIPRLRKTGSNWNTVRIAAQEIRKKLPHVFQTATAAAEHHEDEDRQNLHRSTVQHLLSSVWISTSKDASSGGVREGFEYSVRIS